WFALARVLFIVAVAYSAVQLQPLQHDIENLALGTAIGVAIVALEIRLKETSVTHMLGSPLGGAVGLAPAEPGGAALYWANLGSGRVVFLHSLILLALPYLGMVIGGRRGEWLDPARLITLFRSTAPQRRYRILDTSVIIDGRIA